MFLLIPMCQDRDPGGPLFKQKGARKGALCSMTLNSDLGEALSNFRMEPRTSNALVIGGSSGLGKEVARTLASQGASVTVSGRTIETGQRAADDIGLGASAIALDLTDPKSISRALVGIGPIDNLVIASIERGANSIAEYDIDAAIRLVTMKLVGYAEVIRTLRDRLSPTSSIVLFGGLSLMRPYPGSNVVSTVNGGITGLVHTLACELAPIRINAVHPGVIGGSPYWADSDNSHIVSRTPIGRSVTMEEIVHSVMFLLDNTGVNGVNLAVDGGWLLT
jgi:NAD(P)-dependent dehydrogenase (short-subunit alcohol dehydrogenase family)